ncbi:MAG TPA: phosphoribosylglycinamide synthetase C domain-containing protein [Thermodesulfovibrionales bacterium]|nr:phosphoribosylglycinamide synthetase C domain-containing protein [Thermodesulfovibrionales bacterium]
MKALVLGGGGKEHALVWKLSESKHIDKIYCCPGNAGIAEIAECIDINPYSAEALIDFVKYEWIDFTVVSSEDFVAKGIVNTFEREGCKALGPNASVSQLRSSRVFAKNLMRLYRIPTPGYKVFSSYDLAEDYVRLKGAPIVIKTDGRSGQTGILSAQTVDDAIHALKLIMKDKIAGEAGNQIIIEESIRGQNVSFAFFTDGNSMKPVASLQKYSVNSISSKTYGGSSPASAEGKNLDALAMNKAISQLFRALASEGMAFKGALSIDAILREDEVFISDINCNFAHLEAQIILPRLKTDLAEVFVALLEQRLPEIEVECRQESSVCIPACGEASPEGNVISGLQKRGKDVFIFHEATAYSGKEVIATGEEVLSVTALGQDLNAAMEKADNVLAGIDFKGMHYERIPGIKAHSG